MQEFKSILVIFLLMQSMCTHYLNLVLVDSTKKVSEAADFFSILETLYVFLSRSVTHAIFLKKQSELQPDRPQRQLQRLSDTRWSCRFLAVDALCSSFGSVLATLEEIANGDDRSRVIEATGILSQVQTSKFLVSLITFWRLFSCTKGLSDQLQNRQLDLAKAADLVLATKKNLEPTVNGTVSMSMPWMLHNSIVLQ